MTLKVGGATARGTFTVSVESSDSKTMCEASLFGTPKKVIFTKISDVKIKKEGRQPFRNSRANRAKWLGQLRRITT